MQLQQPIAQQRNQVWVGRVVPVLVEEEDPTTGEKRGRCSRFAPEVDGIVHLQGPAQVGAMVQARITAAHLYDLEATTVDHAIP